MKEKLFFFCLYLTWSNISAQTPSIVWEKSYGGTQGDFPYDMVATRNGRIAICGSSNSVNYNLTCNTDSLNLDYWIYCIDTLGNLLWSRCYGGSADDEAYGIDTTKDGGFIVAGYSSSHDGDVVGNHNNFSADYWVLKLDSIGNIKWSKCYGGTQSEEAFDVVTTSDKGYLISGESFSDDGDITGHHGNNVFAGDYWIVKIDSVGTLQWQRSLGGSAIDYALAGIEFSTKKYLVGGLSESNDADVNLQIGSGDVWMVMIDSAGNIIWEHSYGGFSADQCRKILKTLNRNIIGFGMSESQFADNHGGEDYFAIRIDSLGNLLWKHSYGGTGSDRGRGITLTPDSGFVAIGLSQNSAGTGQVANNYGFDDYWVIKADKNGTLQWEKNFGGSDADIGYSCLFLRKNLYLLGYSNSFDYDVSSNHGGDTWVLELNGYTPVEVITNTNSKFYSYPNPSDQFIYIEAPILFNQWILKISDDLGRVLYEQRLANYQNKIKIEIGNLPNGLYLITIESRDATTLAKKISIVHP